MAYAPRPTPLLPYAPTPLRPYSPRSIVSGDASIFRSSSMPCHAIKNQKKKKYMIQSSSSDSEGWGLGGVGGGGPKGISLPYLAVCM